MRKQKVKDAAINLQREIIQYSLGKSTWRELAKSLDEFIATVLAEWPDDEPTVVTRHRSYFMPGLSGGCTRGLVPLTAGWS